MSIISIAGVQMPIMAVGGNIHGICQKIEYVNSVYPWTDMIVFSELAIDGPILDFAVEDDTDTLAPIRELAQKYNLWILPGSQFVKEDGKIFNRASVINPAGEIVLQYDKMFPFMPYEVGVSAGEKFAVFDVPNIGRFGLSICYDIWMPETTRTLTSMGAEVLLHPVLTGTTDRATEIAIVQATAAMFQCYVVDVNGLSSGGVGRSLVASPSGRVVHQAGQAEETFPIQIDLDVVRRARIQGANGLGQTLKSFRDTNVEFGVYSPDNEQEHLKALGPLQTPRKQI